MNQDRVDAKEPTDEFDHSLLSAYLDDELSTEERSKIDVRLQAEPALRQTLRDLRSVSSIIKSASVQPIISKVIQGEWNRSVDPPLEGRFFGDAKPAKSDELLQAELRKGNVFHRRWMGLAALAASILVIASATFLLPSALPVQGTQHARLEGKKDSVSTEEAVSLQDSLGPIEPSTSASETQVGDENASMAEKQSAPLLNSFNYQSPDMAKMNRDRISNDFQKYSLIKPEELPSDTILIRAKRNITSAEQAVVESEDLAQARQASPAYDVPLLKAPSAKGAFAKAGEDPRSEKGSKAATSQELMEIVVRRSQIASLLADSQLIKLDQKDLLADASDTYFFSREKAMQSSNGRSIHRYEMVDPSQLAEKLKFQAQVADSPPQDALAEPANGIQAKRLTGSDKDSVPSEVDTKELIATSDEPSPSSEAKMERELKMEDDWVHVIIEIVP